MTKMPQQCRYCEHLKNRDVDEYSDDGYWLGSYPVAICQKSSSCNNMQYLDDKCEMFELNKDIVIAMKEYGEIMFDRGRRERRVE